MCRIMAIVMTMRKAAPWVPQALHGNDAHATFHAAAVDHLAALSAVPDEVFLAPGRDAGLAEKWPVACAPGTPKPRIPSKAPILAQPSSQVLAALERDDRQDADRLSVPDDRVDLTRFPAGVSSEAKTRDAAGSVENEARDRMLPETDEVPLRGTLGRREARVGGEECVMVFETAEWRVTVANSTGAFHKQR
jgi:hypothetical protein